MRKLVWERIIRVFLTCCLKRIRRSICSERKSRSSASEETWHAPARSVGSVEDAERMRRRRNRWRRRCSWRLQVELVEESATIAENCRRCG
ncbi:hypothetical protein DBV15_05670 [Temnothorax longispinosus]|uniref:Uncharacterized protein n=1 Tax=Temnothorax longispinosus TaxID=300112 RepID=A0A4V3S7H2_9HYME|nr:hypothetical protein DBV15_05670 [Temnothorax longispinosus]